MQLPSASQVHQASPLPPNTVLLSTMLSDLSAQPGFDDTFIAALGKQSKTGAAILSPKLLDALRTAILGQDWQGLDRFPGWKMRDIDPAADLAGDAARETEAAAVSQTKRPVAAYIDLGPYALSHSQRIDLDQPSTLPGFSLDGLVGPLGDGVVRGDGPDPEVAPMHSESQRMADVLNRLVVNRLDGAAPATAVLGGREVRTPEDLVRALIGTGHEVTVVDARYFANFGHLHYEGMDVMMPFWVNTQASIPGTNRQLLVPVAHAEYEWFIRGPKVNADVAFYFGIDGRAEFRTMDQLDQAWVMGRHAHEYRGVEAVEVTRLTGLLVQAYAHAHQNHPELPFGGYYALGVCQDGVAAIEKKMTGATTLFPNTADMALFRDPRDAEVNTLLAAIPKDRSDEPPQLERVFGSLPSTDLAAIEIPGLAPDLQAVYSAWQDRARAQGPRREMRSRWILLLRVGALCLIVTLVLRRRRRSQ
jgi:hypothetical protein